MPVDMSNYTDVKSRIALFYAAHPDGRLVTERVEIWQDVEPPRVVVKALAYRTPDDPLPGAGWSWLTLPGTTNFTRGSEIENAETSAWGRAIGALGIGIGASIASSDEIDAKKDDGPVPEPSVRESEGGLIGVASLGKTAPVDGELRETPDGMSIGFVIGEGREKVQVVATGPLAEPLAAVLPLVIGERVQVYGPVSMQSMRVGNYDRKFPRLGLVQIKTNDWTMPPPADTVPMFPDDEEAAAIIAAEHAEAKA